MVSIWITESIITIGDAVRLFVPSEIDLEIFGQTRSVVDSRVLQGNQLGKVLQYLIVS